MKPPPVGSAKRADCGGGFLLYPRDRCVSDVFQRAPRAKDCYKIALNFPAYSAARAISLCAFREISRLIIAGYGMDRKSIDRPRQALSSRAAVLRVTRSLLLISVISRGFACSTEFSNPLDLEGTDPTAIFFVLNARAFVPSIGFSWERVSADIGTRLVPGSSFSDPDFRDEATLLAYKQRLYFMGGDVSFGDGTKEVFASSDGVTWSKIASNAFYTTTYEGRKQHASVVFNGRMWVIGGTTRFHTTADAGTVSQAESVLYSTDGITWTNAAPGCAQCPVSGEAFVYRGKLWMLEPSSGGANSRIFSTTDGVTWAVQTTNARITPITSLVFKDRMWAIGGTGLNNPVWSSADGVNWTREVASVASSVTGHGLVFDNRMWIFPRYALPDSFGDAVNNPPLYSYDGRVWTVAEAGCCAMSAPRDYFSSVVFNNRMWLVAGTGRVDGSSKPYGDAWASLGGGTGVDSGSRSDGSR